MYTLITSKGKVYTFYIKAVAEQYQGAYGGVIFDKTIVTRPLTAKLKALK